MQVLDDIELKEQPPKRVGDLFNIAFFCIFLGVLLGALMAGFNAWMSPAYFQSAMGWSSPEVRPASLIQGALGGFAYGFAYAGYFVIVCGWATQFTCTFPFAGRQLLKVALIVLITWASGGFIENAFFQPPSYEQYALSEAAGLTVPDWHFRWVEGAILGQKVGFLLSALLSPIIVWRAWKKKGGG